MLCASFAFLCIFAHHTLTHSNPLTGFPSAIWFNTTMLGLKFAVSLFFLLSGYLITKLLAIEKQVAGGVHLRDFYIRRIARIWPLYYFFVAASFLVGLVFVNESSSHGALLSFLFLVATDGPRTTSPRKVQSVSFGASTSRSSSISSGPSPQSCSPVEP